MHEKVDYLFAQKTITSFTVTSSPSDSLQFKFKYLNICNQHFQELSSLHLISCSFSLIVAFTIFSNIYLHQEILHKISKPFISKFFELSRRFGGAIP